MAVESPTQYFKDEIGKVREQDVSGCGRASYTAKVLAATTESITRQRWLENHDGAIWPRSFGPEEFSKS